MNLKDYLRKALIKPQPNLELIWEELLNSGYSYTEIYDTVNEVLVENLKKLIDDYNKKKNEN
jgi:hypothetical protein